ncbi:MAG TPA: energy-coupling factor ABC transporter permease [Polyangiaceae bacterium]|nr:energy-coupling factor ABC transporter permease [Polyangiaceae bacterium]
MHIPDGFLSARVALGYGAVSALGLAAACFRLRAQRDRGASALLGVSAAFVFAAQMVNFPIGAGTSGHLIGSALASALLGLPGALLAMSAVTIMQCFVLADGGVFALGANVFNLGLVGCVVGYCCYRLLCGRAPSPTRRVASVAFAGWCATLASASSCAGQLALSGTAPLFVLIPSMLGVHALVGVGEAVISALVVATVLRFRPELLENGGAFAPCPRARATAVQAGLGLSVAVAIVLAPLADAAPDGFSRVTQALGVSASAASPVLAPLAEYGIPGVVSGVLATVLAGCIGTLLLFGLCWLLALSLVPRSARAAEPSRAVAESSG